MEHSISSAEMLEQIIYPAFVVKDNQIIAVNQAASNRGISAGCDVSAFIAIGEEEYRQYSGGKLCLTLSICGIKYAATVSNVDEGHLFCIESDYEDPNLRALALAAQQLRSPLGSAMVTMEQLLSAEANKENAQNMENLAQLNRSLIQLLRAVGNMSDSANYVAKQNFHMQLTNITETFSEILEKVSNTVTNSGRKLQYKLPCEPVYTIADAEKLERAVLNLLTNAIQHSPDNSTIFLDIHKGKNKLFFTVTDNGEGIDTAAHATVFSRFLREPGIEKGNHGIGLGMTIVRAVAAAHNGTVLLEKAETGGAKFTMTIEIRHTAGESEDVVSTPIRLPFDYAGGRDHVLLELSDVLPNALYNNLI